MARSSFKQTFTGSVLVLALTAACSGNVVNVGENPDQPEANAACPPAGTVVVRNQAELDALEGCEAIDGDLYIVPFTGTDLSPLHALRSVEGALRFDAAPGTVDGAEFNRIADVVRAGWLPSLRGLESLERVGYLYLSGISAPDLTALSNLRALTGSGALYLLECPGLRDLRGLENLLGVDSLYIGCENIESLSGLTLPLEMTSLQLAGASLARLSPLGVRYILLDLVIADTGLENLDAFGELESVYTGAVALLENARLVDANGLESLQNARALTVLNNPALQSLPAFEALTELDGLVISNNAALRTPPSFPGLSAGMRSPNDDPEAGGRSAERIEIRDNPELRRFDMPIGWTGANEVILHRNTSLEQLNLGRLANIDQLELEANPQLSKVELGALETVDSLSVIDNPLLADSTFDAVQTFEREMAGNAGAP